MEIDDLKALIDLMNENSLAELEIEEKGKKIRLVKVGSSSREVVAVPTAMAAMTQAPTMMAEAAAAGAAAGTTGAAAEPEADIHIIKAPMVGTLYRASSPDIEPFADVGMQISDESTVCIIEAMKVMNEIHAEVSGTIVEVLVENGHPVEYGQPLFKVKVEE